jgi:acyl-CoA thioester hydrolase
MVMEKWFDLYRGIVMPGQCDLYGHMNVRHYAALFDDAGWHILSRAGISLTELGRRGLGSVVASLTIDFHNEMKAGNLVLIQGSFTRLGVKSFSYEMRMYEADSMTHCATQKTVEVCFDTEKRISAHFPDDVRQKLTAMV